MKPQVKLVGEDGNIFSILGRCTTAGRKAGWSPEQIKEFTDKIMDCESYDAALQLVMQNFEVS